MMKVGDKIANRYNTKITGTITYIYPYLKGVGLIKLDNHIQAELLFCFENWYVLKK